MKNIKSIAIGLSGILFLFAISCNKDTFSNGTGIIPPCTNCTTGSNPNPTTIWRSIEINTADWILDSAGNPRCHLDVKVSEIDPWDYGAYTYPSIAFDYGTSTMQIINQGDSLARNGGLFILKGQDVIFKSQNSSLPDAMHIEVHLQPE